MTEVIPNAPVLVFATATTTTTAPTGTATTATTGTGTTTSGTEVPAEGHGGGHAKIFPPLDPTTFAPQLIWLALTFGALYLVLSRVVLPRIGGMLEARRNHIQRDLAEAERLKAETDKALKDYEQALAEAKGKAQGIAQATRDKLKAEVEARRAEIDKTLAERTASADARIAAAKFSALGKVNEIATDTAEAILADLIGLKVSRDEAAAAVGAVRRH